MNPEEIQKLDETTNANSDMLDLDLIEIEKKFQQQTIFQLLEDHEIASCL